VIVGGDVFAGGVFAALTVGVTADRALTLPALLVAVTTALIVVPTSTPETA
jgi:hypothetical protein